MLCRAEHKTAAYTPENTIVLAGARYWSVVMETAFVPCVCASFSCESQTF